MLNVGRRRRIYDAEVGGSRVPFVVLKCTCLWPQSGVAVVDLVPGRTGGEEGDASG